MNDITVQELRDRMQKGESLHIIDVRELHEYDEFNIGAMHMPLGNLPARWQELEPWMNEEIIVHCRSGNRSAQAKLFLEDMGFGQVRNLLGGMLAWKDAFGN